MTGGLILPTGGPTDAAVLLDRVAMVERAVDSTAGLHLILHVIPNAVAASAAELWSTTLSPQGTDGVILLFFGRAPDRPLLRVSRVAVMQVAGPDTVGQTKGTLSPPDNEIVFSGEANAVDISFAEGAELAPDTVIAGESLLFDGPVGTLGKILVRGPNLIRYYDPAGFSDVRHTLVLKGDGNSYIAAKDSSRLAGDYVGDERVLPSGGQYPGGDFVIAIARNIAL